MRQRNQNTKLRTTRQSNRRDEIIQKAAALFEQRGYRAVSVDTIVDDVGISKPTFYSYLESKDEILWEIYETLGVEARKSVRSILNSEGNAREKLHKFLRVHLEHLALRREFYVVYFQEESELPKRLQNKFKLGQREYLKMVEDIFRQGIQEKLFPEVDPKMAALGILGMCNWASRWYKSNGTLRPNEIADNFFAMLTGLSTENNK